MTPQRLAQVPIEPAALGFLAVLSAALSVVVTGVNLFLGMILVVAMILDQVSGMVKCAIISPRGKRWYDGRKFMKGGLEKFLVLIGVLACGLIDMASLHIPAWGDIAARITPATKVGLVYAIVGQLGSVITNVSIVKEAQLLAAFMMRRMDAAKLGHEPPARREAYDRQAIRMEEALETADGEPFWDAVRRRDEDTRGGAQG